MCLAIPARVKSVEGYEAEVEVGGVGRRASIVLTPEAKVGNYVLLHAGYAINVIDEIVDEGYRRSDVCAWQFRQG